MFFGLLVLINLRPSFQLGFVVTCITSGSELLTFLLYFLLVLTSFYLLTVGKEGYCCTWSHADTPQSVGLLWTGDRPFADLTTFTRERERSTSPAGFEPAIPASEQPHTMILDRAKNIEIHSSKAQTKDYIQLSRRIKKVWTREGHDDVSFPIDSLELK